MRIFLYIISLLLIIQACDNSSINTDKRALAKVDNDYLYYEDIVQQIQLPILEEDSAKLINSIVESWVIQELMLKKARINLQKDQIDIDRQVEDYRNTLLVYKYQQKYIDQNLDTVISQAQLEEYYNQYSHDFILDFEAIKALFIKIDSKNPDLHKVRNWYRTDDEEKAQKLDAFCNLYAEVYNDFNGDWVNFRELIKEMPFNYSNNEVFLKYNKSYETRDSLYTYFLNITDYKLSNDTTPLVFIKDDIRKIIINKRKMRLITELEKNTYQDALNSKTIKIY